AVVVLEGLVHGGLRPRAVALYGKWIHLHGADPAHPLSIYHRPLPKVVSTALWWMPYLPMRASKSESPYLIASRLRDLSMFSENMPRASTIAQAAWAVTYAA